MKKIILISGLAGHGKDSTADILMKKLTGNCIKIYFAKYLKIILKDYFKWNGEKDEYGRFLLQYIGTDYIKNDLNMKLFHAQRICEDIKIIDQFYDYILIPDMRFRNELFYTSAVFPNDVISIRVNRLGFQNNLTQDQKNHESEMDISNITHDYTIYTQSGLDHLEDEIDRTFKGILY